MGTLRAWAFALVLTVGLPPGLAAQVPEDPAHPRTRVPSPVTILQVNDVYSTVPVDGAGGLARVATIKKQLAAAGRNTLLMIGGDFLSSSVASTVFRGEQMIAALNAAGLDFATLGNHEFDFGVDMLLTRMQQARWQWVIANIIDRKTNGIIGGASPYVIRNSDGLRVGIIGLCIVNESMTSPVLRDRLQMLDPVETAAKYLPQMKRDGVDVIVALTHLNFSEDRALAARFPEIDVIVGGHEHVPITAFQGRTLISKAGSEARFVARIDLEKRGTADVNRYFELIPVTAAIPDDPEAATVINDWEARLGREMDLPVGSTRVPLEARDIRLRASEVNIGNLIADALRQDVGAEVAIMNSGGIRGNREYPAGEVTRRTIIALNPFNNVVCKIEVTGEQLLSALNFGVSKLPSVSGQFPQVSGMSFRVVVGNPAGDRVRDLRINGTAVDLKRTYTLALPDFLLHGGDGYEMLMNSKVLVDPESANLIVSAIEKLITGREVNPQVENRIVIER
jgi:5'-nucleotidase